MTNQRVNINRAPVLRLWGAVLVERLAGARPSVGVHFVTKKIKINRAPVMTLWAAVVAERLGHDHDTALTLGKAVAGLNAQSKGRRLGIFEENPEKKKKKSKKAEPKQQVPVMLLGRAVPTVRTKDGLRALTKDESLTPQSVQRYLDLKFRDDLSDVQEGEKGWGAKADLDLAKIRSLAK